MRVPKRMQVNVQVFFGKREQQRSVCGRELVGQAEDQTR
jgi:hypothetical protein